MTLRLTLTESTSEAHPEKALKTMALQPHLQPLFLTSQYRKPAGTADRHFSDSGTVDIASTTTWMRYIQVNASTLDCAPHEGSLKVLLCVACAQDELLWERDSQSCRLIEYGSKVPLSCDSV